ncbi:MAG: AAA family ATPase, partial [bacterium]
MKFKRLEMVGFKSFVDRTVIEISDQLTAVVGPNGCGKSNISDAIRWVLGEQSPKSLRAKRMEDLIFNGSAERKQTGMAEVSLTICDLKGTVTAPLYKDFDELVVTRRLYRSGESEYLINRNPCRLKDITDIFLDTGVSLDTFSIVEQGRIESLVNAKPLDRRLLIEEAAGIMKYKSRRNEALRKLDLAQANLLRVGDVMREKETRLRSLRRQARKATFFKEYRAEVETLDLTKSSLDLLLLEEELKPVEREHDRLKNEEEGLAAALSARDADRERCRIELAERSERLAEARRRAVETEGILLRLENRLEMLSAQLVELDAEEERRAEEVETLSREAERLEEESERLSALEAALAGETEQSQRRFDVGAAELAAVRGELSEVEAAAAQARRTQEEEVEALSRSRQRVVAAESQREGVGRSLERIGREMEEAERLRAEVRAEAESLAARFEEIAGEEKRLKEEAERLAGEKARLEEQVHGSEASLTAERETLVKSRSSLQELERLEEEGGSERVGAAGFRACGAEVLDALANILIVEPRFQKAIEAALGERLLGVVVKDFGSALEAVRALAASGEGRGLALPLEARRESFPSIPEMEGVLGPAIGFVRCPDAYRPLMESLLGGVGVARDLDSARAAWERGPGGAVWTTLEGEVILPSGAVEGGVAAGERSGLLERTRRREQLRIEVEAFEGRLAETEARLARQS